MNAKYYVTGQKRKCLVSAIEDITGTSAIYQKTPNFEYVIGEYTVDRHGTITCQDPEALKRLVEELLEAGFTAEDWGEEAPVQLTEEELTQFTIEVPLDKVNVENLTKLLEAKGNLIRKALGTVNLRIETKEDRVAFPWFPEVDADQAKAYTDFIAAICKMSREAKRVTATEKEVENEKYAFRCFLLRLGFIGAEYKKDRKILLKNLTGSASFRNGGAGHETSE